MKKILFCGILLLLCKGHAQHIVKLPFENQDAIVWEGKERAYFSDSWQTAVVTNVSSPTMEVFAPEEGEANGTAVIIAPGGALYAHSINSEGNDVAKWLNRKGITAFVLKYRLVPTVGDGVAQMAKDGMGVMEKAAKILPLATQDGLNAIAHVRSHAKEYGVDSQKIGFMGFSAGGAVTMNLAFTYSDVNRPNFIVPVYPWMSVVPAYQVPNDAPPMLVICASDDPLGLAPMSVDLYSAWSRKDHPTELHMYAKGGHGFGMKEQGLPSDTWIQRFYDWSVSEGLTLPKK
jgi:acetyl esterase/lipase